MHRTSAVKYLVVAFTLAISIGTSANFVYADEEPIKIGSISILSGEGASWGTAARNGVPFAN
jgi:ABC-type branched-subunit amino acid transport system substrate-binding protein